MNDEEFDAKLACLNALYGGTLFGEGIWKSVKAAKEHTDHFGDNISRGEYITSGTYWAVMMCLKFPRTQC